MSLVTQGKTGQNSNDAIGNRTVPRPTALPRVPELKVFRGICQVVYAEMPAVCLTFAVDRSCCRVAPPWEVRAHR
jgi:hypothetical protein